MDQNGEESSYRYTVTWKPTGEKLHICSEEELKRETIFIIPKRLGSETLLSSCRKFTVFVCLLNGTKIKLDVSLDDEANTSSLRGQEKAKIP
jgi:hypothetical protein